MDTKTSGNARAVCLESPGHKEVKKWKSPYERALERVRTPKRLGIKARSHNDHVVLSSSEDDDPIYKNTQNRGEKQRRKTSSQTEQSMVCGMSSSVVSTIDILERKNSSASNGSCTSIVNGRNPTHANTALVHELRNHVSSDVWGRDGSNATSSCKNTRISRHTLKEVEEKSKGTQFEVLIERYHSLVHEAMQKKKEEAIREENLEELVRALLKLQEDNRKLKCAAEEASLESLHAKEQVSQFLEQARLNGSLHGCTSNVKPSKALGQANELLQTLHQEQNSAIEHLKIDVKKNDLLQQGSKDHHQENKLSVSSNERSPPTWRSPPLTPSLPSRSPLLQFEEMDRERRQERIEEREFLEFCRLRLATDNEMILLREALKQARDRVRELESALAATDMEPIGSPPRQSSMNSCLEEIRQQRVRALMWIASNSPGEDKSVSFRIAKPAGTGPKRFSHENTTMEEDHAGVGSIPAQRVELASTLSSILQLAREVSAPQPACDFSGNRGNPENMLPFSVSVLFLPTVSCNPDDTVNCLSNSNELMPLSPTCMFRAPLSEDSSMMVSEDCVSTTALSTVNDTAQKSPAGVGLALLDQQDSEGFSHVYVHGIIHGGAAHREGSIQVGDVILFVDEEDVCGISHPAVRSRVIGDAGTRVRLRLQRMLAMDQWLKYEVELERGILPDVALKFNGVDVCPASEDSDFDENVSHPSSERLEPRTNQAAAHRQAPHSMLLRTPMSSPLSSPRKPELPHVIQTSPVGIDSTGEDPDVLGVYHKSIVPYAARGTRSAPSVGALPIPDVVMGCSEGSFLPTFLHHSLHASPRQSPILNSVATPLSQELASRSRGLGSELDYENRVSLPSADLNVGRWRLSARIGRANEVVRLQGDGLPNLFCRVAVISSLERRDSAGGRVLSLSMQSIQQAAGTRIVDQDINPVWMEEFVFYECSRDHLHHDCMTLGLGEAVELVIVIFDHDVDADHSRFRGVVCINVDPGISNEGWYTIQSDEGWPMYGPSGSPSQILISIHYTFEDPLVVEDDFPIIEFTEKETNKHRPPSPGPVQIVDDHVRGYGIVSSPMRSPAVSHSEGVSIIANKPNVQRSASPTSHGVEDVTLFPVQHLPRVDGARGNQEAMYVHSSGETERQSVSHRSQSAEFIGPARRNQTSTSVISSVFLEGALL